MNKLSKNKIKIYKYYSDKFSKGRLTQYLIIISLNIGILILALRMLL